MAAFLFRDDSTFEVSRTANMDRATRRREEKRDRKEIAEGINAESRSPEPTAAMARTLFSLLEMAKRTGNIDPVVEFYHSKIEATVLNMGRLPIACGKGCSHCCYTWVSAQAVELIYLAKKIRHNPINISAVIHNVAESVSGVDFDTRAENPTACPLLIEQVCSVYQFRPMLCRLAASADAQICARSFHNKSDEDIPTPYLYMTARGAYAVSLASALKHAKFIHRPYELISGLSRALQVNDAEQQWLDGVDVFAGILHEPGDLLAHEQTAKMYKYIFDNGG